MLIAMTIPLTGTQYEIEAGDYRATVTELGAGLRGLRFGDTFLVTGFDANELPPHGAGQLLTPWPNRVDGGRYAFDGEHHALVLPAADLQTGGRSVFWVGQSPYNTGAVAAPYGPQNVVVGDPESPYCAAGFTDSSLAYAEGTGGWDTLEVGDGFRDGPGDVVCVGFSADVDGNVTGWADGVQVGATYAMGYTADQEDWSAIGEGYSGTNKYVGTLGAVIVLPGAADAAVAAKIHSWAQGRFYAR